MKRFILLTLLLLLTACAASQATGGEGASAESTGGGEIVLIIPEEPATLNQYLAVAAIVRQVADATTAGLTTLDVDGNFQPVLAAELPTLENGGVSEDYLTVTWKLRPDLLWSDGEPLTSDDIKFTWEAVSNPESGNVLSLGFDLIETIETPDELTAVVTYSELNQAYLQQFMFGILPRHATGEPAEMPNWEWNRAPVTAGPFVVSDWSAGDTITMERNPSYYLEGQPYLDGLIFAIVPDAGAQVAMARAFNTLESRLAGYNSSSTATTSAFNSWELLTPIAYSMPSSRRVANAAIAPQSLRARSVIASNTGCTSVGELLITCRISDVAVWRSSASCVSRNSRAFSIAITA